MASLNVTEGWTVTLTAVAPLAGDVVVTVGAEVSAP